MTERTEIFGLSSREKEQLGTSKLQSSFEYVTPHEWVTLRQKLVNKSQQMNPLLKDPTMTAYTPGETLKLLEHPTVQDWHREVAQFTIPEQYKTIIVVPCAKTKPWDEKYSKRSSFYRSYHEIINLSEEGKILPVYFATISEPLGIVPQERWGDFPQYDNPGLFRDDFLRTGLVKKDWQSELGERKLLPFDEEQYQQSIAILGNVITQFLEKNSKGRRLLSFVDNPKGELSTHGDMLNTALTNFAHQEIDIQRFPKRRKSREAPTEFILEKIQQIF